MENYLGALILIGVVVVIGGLYYAFSTGMFNGMSSSTAKNAQGIVGTAVNFEIVSPPAGQSYTFSEGDGTTGPNGWYYAQITVEITGDANKLNDQFITIGTNTKGYYVNANLTNDTATIQSQPYAKFKIVKSVSGADEVALNNGDVLKDVYVYADHEISTAGEEVTLQIKVGETIKTVKIYAYPASS